MSVIKSFKGFDLDLKCRGFQFEIGKTYKHEGEVKECRSGFHACELPLNVFSYYPPNNSRYCEVTQSGEISKGDDKTASEEIKVECEVSLLDLAKLHIKYVKSNLNNSEEIHNNSDYSAASNTGDYSAASNTGYQSAASNTGYQSAASNTGNRSAASNTGYQSAASNTGDYSAASNTGYQSAASNTGYQSAASNTGDYSAASNTGNRSAASNTGDYSAASNTGYQSAASNTGNRSAASNTGDYSAAIVEGEESVAIVTGYDSKAKASDGSWVVLTERDDDYNIVNIKSGKAGVDIKPDAFYKLVNNEFVEVK